MKLKKKNIIWNTIGITANSFISLFLLIIVKRVNGINPAGIFTYAFSLACLLYVIAVYYNRVYEVADTNNNYSINEYLTTRFFTSFITIILTILFCFINGFDTLKFILIILLTLFKISDAISDCYYGFIQKKDDLAYVGMSFFFKAFLGVGAFLITDIITKNLILSTILLILVNVIILFIDIKKFYSLYNIKYKITTSKVPKLLKETFPIFIFTFLNIFLCNCQKYVIEYFLDESFQTIFAIIVMPATMLSLCGQYILAPFVNDLSKLYNEKTLNKFNNYINKINIVFLFLGLLILLVAYFLGIPVLNIIYDINLGSYKTSFLIIIVGAIFFGLASIISNLLTIIKRNKEQLYVYLVSAIVSLTVSILLIKNYALYGASWAYLITMSIQCLISYILLKYYMKKENN